MGVLALTASLPGLIPMFRGQVHANRDLVDFFLPMKLFLGARLRAGDIPLWDPYTESGIPFLANLQSQVFYLPNTLLSLLPLATAHGLFVAFHLALGAVGLYLWARSYGLGRAAAVIGGLAFGLGGPMVASVEFSSILAVAAWIPWGCWAASRVAGDGRARYFAAWVAAVAGMGLGGEPHLALAGAASGVLAGLVAPSSTAADARLRLRARAAWLLGGGALAAGIIAFQLLPFLELVRHSERAAGLPLALSLEHSARARELLGLLAPSAHAFDSLQAPPWGGQSYLRLHYVGVVALIGALLAVVGLAGRDRRRSEPAAVALGLLVTGWLLALGAGTPLFALLRRAGL
ncbi:MAG: hypothetical protein ACE5HV_07590, partial [Acidobacteriota bacterium]